MVDYEVNYCDKDKFVIDVSNAYTKPKGKETPSKLQTYIEELLEKLKK